jgi:hypothetical protein
VLVLDKRSSRRLLTPDAMVEVQNHEVIEPFAQVGQDVRGHQ